MVYKRSEHVLWSIGQIFCFLFISRVKSIVNLSRNRSLVSKLLEDVPSDGLQLYTKDVTELVELDLPTQPMDLQRLPNAFTRAKLPI